MVAISWRLYTTETTINLTTTEDIVTNSFAETFSSGITQITHPMHVPPCT